MILDILVAVILILSMVSGYRAGFVWTFFHTLGWIVAIICAFVWTPRMKDFLISNTGLYDVVHSALSERFTGASGSGNLSSDFPRMLQETVDSLIRQATDAASTALADLVFTIVSFLIVLFTVKFVIFLIVLAFSKQNAEGVRGAIDGTFGLVFGFVKGVFLVFVLLALMIPLMGIFDSNFVDTIAGWLDSSFFARSLYDNNFLALVFRDFLF